MYQKHYQLQVDQNPNHTSIWSWPFSCHANSKWIGKQALQTLIKPLGCYTFFVIFILCEHLNCAIKQDLIKSKTMKLSSLRYPKISNLLKKSLLWIVCSTNVTNEHVGFFNYFWSRLHKSVSVVSFWVLKMSGSNEKTTCMVERLRVSLRIVPLKKILHLKSPETLSKRINSELIFNRKLKEFLWNRKSAVTSSESGLYFLSFYTEFLPRFRGFFSVAQEKNLPKSHSSQIFLPYCEKKKKKSLDFQNS